MNENPQEHSPGNDLLVAGAASLIGRFLLSRARAAGLKPLALSRRGGDLQADLTKAATLAKALPRISRMTSLAPIWLLPAALPVLADKGLARLVAFSSTSRFTKAASSIPEERAVADQLARADFTRPGAPWLVVVFTSASCQACGAVMDTARPLESDQVAVQEVEVGADRRVHDRYRIDGDGVVRAHHLGPVTEAHLWGTLAEVREPGSTPDGRGAGD